jgi:hypothetical protein
VDKNQRFFKSIDDHKAEWAYLMQFKPIVQSLKQFFSKAPPLRVCGGICSKTHFDVHLDGTSF